MSSDLAAGRGAAGAGAVVMDITSSTCRAGLATAGGADRPVSTFTCAVGRRKEDPETVYIGDEALKRRRGNERSHATYTLNSVCLGQGSSASRFCFRQRRSRCL